MKNHEVAELLNKIADLLEIKNELIFKIRAYRKAAFVIENLSEDIQRIYSKEVPEKISGVGEGISKKIKEFLDTGKLEYFEKLKKETPVKIDELRQVEGLGPKTILKLYKKLDIRDLKDLENAARQGKIQNIEGFGKKVEENIISGIEYAKKSDKRSLLLHGLHTAEKIKKRLEDFGIDKVEIAGSIRRRKDTIRDIDILVSTKFPEKAMDFFTTMEDIDRIISKGKTKSTIQMHDIQADLRIIEKNKFGSALLYFTGSKQHNISLRKIAIKKGYKLSEYGIFDKKTNKLLASKKEEDCYRMLGMDYIEPELREDEGEIQAAMKGDLPKLISYDEIKGDLQMHTKWSDGSNSIEEMALAAKNLGHEYISITDHVGNLKIANAMSHNTILRQKEEISRLNKKLNKNNFTILHGVEVNIRHDGSLDMKNEVLEGMDIVLASIHSGFKNSKEKMTKRIIKAMENENVDIIAHPTGRLINRRSGYEIDLEKVFEYAKKTKTLLEINSSPERLDLNDKNTKSAISHGIKMVISTDAHNADQLQFIKLGIATARRGWAETKDITNSLPLKDFLKKLK